VVGLKDDDLGRRVHALIEPANADAPPALEELDAHLRLHLASYKLPRGYKIVARLPRDEAGKSGGLSCATIVEVSPAIGGPEEFSGQFGAPMGDFLLRSIGRPGAIIFALGGILLAGTAVAQESPPTCHGLDFEQCHLARGCTWDEVLMQSPGWEWRVCIPMCVKEPVIRVIKREGTGWLIRRTPRGLIP